jgi:glutamate--cysteine ligase
MLFRSLDHDFTPGIPGFSFANWVSAGHEEYGWPTVQDLDYHLTTLFFEVRARGFLELRAGEALPDRWRAAQVVLIAALLYDEQARSEALDALSGIRACLQDYWHRASVAGVRDPDIGALAQTTWAIAIRGAERMPSGFFGARALCAAREFLDRYTNQNRMPADELAELNQQDPAAALSWASSGHSGGLLADI